MNRKLDMLNSVHRAAGDRYTLRVALRFVKAAKDALFDAGLLDDELWNLHDKINESIVGLYEPDDLAAILADIERTTREFRQSLDCDTAPPAAQASDTGRGEALSVFDAALAAELPRVSHVEYDSHEICKHFAGKLRERIATHTPASEDSAGKDGDLTDAMIIAGERVLNEYERGQHREESVVEEMWAAMLAAREGVQS